MKDPYLKDYSAIYRGVVEDNIDPENLGRCKIRVPSIHGELLYPVEILPWSRPIAPAPTGKNRGSVIIPEIGDIVWVFFEGANREFPVYLGGTYATGELDIKNKVVDFYIEDDTKISYDRVEKKYSIQIGNTKLVLSQDKIEAFGDCYLDNSLYVKGDISVSGDLSVGKNLHISGDTIVNDSVDIQGNLRVRGDTILDNYIRFGKRGCE